MADLSSLAADLRTKDEIAARLAEDLKRANAAAAEAEVAFFDAALAAGTTEYKSLDGVKYKLDVGTHYSCLAGNREALYEACEPRGLGAIFKPVLSARPDELPTIQAALEGLGMADLIDTSFTVHPATLDATMRELDDKGQLPEEVRMLLSVYDAKKVKRPKIKLEVTR